MNTKVRALEKVALIFLVAILLAALVVGPASAAPPKPKLSTPTISCAGSTQTAINVQVCAGTTGAPAGFSIQWMTAADYATNGGWYTSDDPRLCKASFSGNASGSRYALGSGECVTVDVGEFLFDNGASTNCIDALLCGTDYVFHSFAHATNTQNKSDLTANLTCGTLPCGHGDSCTLTQGYWKTHNDTVCVLDPASPLCVAWPVTSLSLGNVVYSQADLLAIFNKPAAGNGLISLAHQLIAAKLNIANGADGTAITSDIAAADALIGNLVVPPIGTDSLPSSSTSGLTTSLGNYNEGATGPGHCD